VRDIQLKIYDLFSGGQTELKDAVREIVFYLGVKELENPFYNIVRELATNGLKAIYKRIFYDQVVSVLDIDGVNYQEWLHLFKAEIESHSAKNLGEQARVLNQGVDILIHSDDDVISIDILNPGLPTEIEQERISKSIQKSMESKDFAYLLDDGEEEDQEKEGAGIGLPLVIMTLRGLGISIEHFYFTFTDNQTKAHIQIDIENLANKRKTPTSIRTMEDVNQIAKAFYLVGKTLDHFVLIFNKKGELIEASKNFISRVVSAQTTINDIRKAIPNQFFVDIFEGPNSIINTRKMENYRIRVNLSGEMDMFNVNGISSKREEVITIWQKVVVFGQNPTGEGDILDRAKVQNITQKYVPATVIQKAREAVRYGKSELPSEVRESTAFFADIMGFTSLSETMEPPSILDLLNTSLSVIAKTITVEGGTIDKFMGDAVFSLFDSPLRAIIAAVKIQNAFERINEFREINSEPPIFLRIGIHTGTILIGNIGTNERMEWTAIGDVINTARRIQENGEKENVLISEDTYKRVKEQVEVKDSFQLTMKGKSHEMLVHYVRSVRFQDKNDKTKEQLIEIKNIAS